MKSPRAVIEADLNLQFVPSAVLTYEPNAERHTRLLANFKMTNVQRSDAASVNLRRREGVSSGKKLIPQQCQCNPANESQRPGRYNDDTGEHHDRRPQAWNGLLLHWFSFV
jgi:hypothetical protein